MHPKNILLREIDLEKLRQLSEKNGCSANAVVRQLIQGAKL